MSKVSGKNVSVLQKLKAHSSDVTCVEFWGNVLLITGSSDKTVRAWKWVVGDGFVEEPFSPLLGHKYGVTSVKISPQAMDHKKELDALSNYNAHKIDVLTPHKISVVLLVQHYLKAKQQATDMGATYPAQARRKFCMLLLKLIHYPEMTYKDLHNLLTSPRYKIEETHLEGFEKCMSDLNTLGIENLFDAFDTQNVMDKILSENSAISQYGIVGLYIRRIIVTLDRMSFPEIMSLYKCITTYYEKGVRALAICPVSCEAKDESFLDSQTIHRDRNSHSKWSIKQAELFIAQQNVLLETNELRALPPIDLQNKLNEIVHDNPLLSQAHFLTYMNNLRLRDLFSSLNALHRSFDRSPVQTFNPTETKGFQYASLNLAIMHTNFNHIEEALASLKESIMIAQECGDKHCLELANAWYCILNSKNIKPNDKCIPDQADLNMVISYSLSIQFIVKVAALCGYKPSELFELMLRSDEVNCRNSLMELVANALAQRAGLWTLYGKNEVASVCSQLLLKLNKSWAFGDIGNSESICQVLCCLALWFSLQGEFALSAVVLHHAKERFRRDPLAKNWMICDCYITIQQAIYKCKWQEGIKACCQLYIFDEHASILQRAGLCIAKRNLPIARRMLDKLLTFDDLDSLTYVRALILQAYCMITSQHIAAEVVTILSRALAYAKEKYLEYEAAIVDMMFARVLLQMNMPQKALETIKGCMETILTNGGIYDRAKTMLVFAKCLVASAATAEEKIKRISDCMDIINEAVEFFKKLEAHSKVKDVYIFLATVYNDVQHFTERNNYARMFKLYHLEFPTPKEYLDVFF